MIRDTVAQALDQWPDMIHNSQILDAQKERLLHHLETHPFAQHKGGGQLHMTEQTISMLANLSGCDRHWRNG